MKLKNLRTNIIIHGPILPEPVQRILVVPMGESIKIVGKGLKTDKVHEPDMGEYIQKIIGMRKQEKG